MSYVTIPLLFSAKERLAEDTGLPADSYAVGCKIKVFFGNDSGKGSKKMKRGRDCADML